MKVSVDKDRGILLEEVFNGVGLKTNHGEFMGICMRDTGFEFNYQGTWYEAKEGVVKPMKTHREQMSCHQATGTTTNMTMQEEAK